MDKVQKIREEVERLKSLIGNNSFLSDYEKGCNDGREDMCDEIISIIDSMQEEPVSNPIDFEQELYKAFGQVKDFTLCMRIAKRFYDMGKKSREPVSEELEEEIIRYVGYPQEVDEDISTTMIRKAARHFANWQKEQMMTKSIEAVVSQVPCSNEIILYNPSSVDKYYLPQEMNKLGLNKGDKVKLVIIKED